MERSAGIFDRIALAMTGKRNPWGKAGGGSGGDSGDGSGGDGPDGGADGQPNGDANGGSDKPEGPRNPWVPTSVDGGKPRRSANIEDIFRNRGPEGPKRGGGGPGSGGPNFNFPQRSGGKSWAPLILIAVVVVWLGSSMIHFVQPREQAVVTTFGKYANTMQPGTNLSWPWPVQTVDKADVLRIRSEKIPASGDEKLILTGDQNLVDLSYLIRWNVKDLSLFRFQLAEPEETVAEVAEAAMRAAVAGHNLDEVMSGSGRAEIEQDVLANMQSILDAYGSGVAVQGIEINKADPPTRVEEAFKDVSSARQDADAFKNKARADAQQWLNRAEGDAAEFNNIYAEYRLAPVVTRRRMYYETMESVLAKTDKMIVEADGVTPYLPLPELQRRSQAAAATEITVEGGQ